MLNIKGKYSCADKNWADVIEVKTVIKNQPSPVNNFGWKNRLLLLIYSCIEQLPLIDIKKKLKLKKN